MIEGPKTPGKSRLAGGIQHLTLATALLAVAMVPGLANGYSCDDIVDTIEQGKAPDSTKTKSNDAATAVRTSQTIKTITIDELFTFESSGDTMGFLPGKRIIKPKAAELEAIVKLANSDQEALFAIASEMAFYFEALPLTAVSSALDLVTVRNRLDIDPVVMRNAYQTAFEIVFHPQSADATPFPPNTSAGVTHEGVIGLAMMQISSKNISFDEIRDSMIHLEQTFPDAKRIHQLRTLQVYIASKVKDANASIKSLSDDLSFYQEELVIRKTVIGFNNSDATHPSIEQALMLHILAGRANIETEEMVLLARHLIQTQSPASFDDVASMIGSALKDLDQKNAAKAPQKIQTDAKRLGPPKN